MLKQIMAAACLAAIITMVSCKKDAMQPQGPAPATPQQLAAENSQLAGTWAYVWGQIAFFNVGFIPQDNGYPFGGSVRFDGNKTATVIDLYGNTTTKPYTLTGLDTTFYVNVTDTGTDTLKRACQVTLLTADSLILTNTLTGADTATKLIYTQIFTKALQADVTGNIFRVTISPFISGQYTYPLDVNANIYVTHSGGQPQLADSVTNITQAWSYAYTPAVGDTVHIVLSGAGGIYGFPVVKCIAYYRGVPFGIDWLSSGASSALDKSWTINN